jgi:hypothetical protein
VNEDSTGDVIALKHQIQLLKVILNLSFSCKFLSVNWFLFKIIG